MGKRPGLRALKTWRKRFFRAEVFTPGGKLHTRLGREEAPRIRRLLGLKKGARLLDLCCGTGRHSIPLARSGIRVTGLDATDAYLKQARRAARRLANAKFLKGDMRRLAFRGEFDAVINLWTSFGYFLEQKDDLKVLKGAARALKPGGRFLIDIVDADYLRKHAQPKRWDDLPGGGYRLEDFHMFEGRDPAQINTWTLLRPGKKPVSATFFVRSYDRRRLSRLLREAGLIPYACWSDFKGSSYRRSESRRLILAARKPYSSSSS